MTDISKTTEAEAGGWNRTTIERIIDMLGRPDVPGCSLDARNLNALLADVERLQGEINRLRAGAEKVIADFEDSAKEHAAARDADEAEYHASMAWKLRRDILGEV